MGKYNKGASTNLIHIVSDCVFAMFAFVVTLTAIGVYYYCHSRVLFPESMLQGDSIYEMIGKYFLAVLAFTIIYLLSNKESRMYNVTTFFYADRVLRMITKSFLLAFALEFILLYIGNARLDSAFVIIFLILMYCFMVISTIHTRWYIKGSNRFAPRTLLVGTVEQYERFRVYLNKGNTDINILGYVSFWQIQDERYIGSLDQLEALIHDNAVDQVYIMHERGDGIDIQHYLDLCIEMGVTFRVVMNELKNDMAQSYVSSVGTYPVMTYHTVSLNMSSRAVKRMIDILCSIVGIVLSSPIMLVTAIAIKIDSPGPVIFKQERVGKNGRHFYIYKFRSMCNDAERLKKSLAAQNEMEGGFMFKIHDDPRITRVGRIIRKLNIDELPQFFNVLFGSMSMVGTRPPTLDEVEKYERSHWRRMSIKPGITGMWQVSGRSNITDFSEIVRLDTEYIDKWSIMGDFRIMFLTVVQMLKRDGSAC